MEQTNQELVTLISQIVNPTYQFDLEPTESAHGFVKPVEDLDVLYFKCKASSSFNQDKELVEKVKGLGIDFYRVEICKFQYLGKYLLVYLPKYIERYAHEWNEYIKFKQENQEQIKKIHKYLDLSLAIPEDFVGWVLKRELKY